MMAIGFLELAILIIVAIGGLLAALAASSRRPSDATATQKPFLVYLGALLAITLLIFFSIRTWFVFGIIAIGLLVIGIPIALLVNPKTRSWGIGLAVVPATIIMVVLVFGAYVFFFFSTRHDMASASIERASNSSTMVTTRVGDLPSAPIEIQLDNPPQGSKEASSPPENTANSAVAEEKDKSIEKSAEIKSSPRKKKTKNNTTVKRPSNSAAAKNSGSEPTSEKSANKNSPKTPVQPAVKTPSKPTGNERPRWVDQPSDKVGDTYQVVVHVGPYTTRLECDRALSGELRRAVADYVSIYLTSDEKHSHFAVNLPDDYVEDHVVQKTWEETKVTSVGPMKQLHVLLVFDRKANDLIKQMRHDVQVKERLTYGGIGLVGVLFVLLLAYSAIKIDITTKGKHRRILFLSGIILFVIVLIIGILLCDMHITPVSEVL